MKSVMEVGRMLSLYLGMLENDGERESFAAYYNEHQSRCLALAYSITRNYAWAEEAVHDSFLRLIRYKDKYFTDLRKKTGTQIFIMVRSEALNILRREKRLDHTLLEDVEPILDNDEPDAFRVVTGKETVNRLQYHVSQLDEISQALYEMKYILGKSDGDIAETVGLSKNAVAIRVHRLGKRLFDTMQEEGYVNECRI
jgi:RNA polymerase sigma-70 factor (ECF subfamily)